jgi:hypothetical protein
VILLDICKHECAHILHIDLQIVVLQDSFFTAIEQINENLAVILDSGIRVQFQVLIEAERQFKLSVTQRIPENAFEFFKVFI